MGGKVWFNGHEIENMKEKDFRKIRGNEVSIIFQDPMTSLNPVYTIGNQIVEVILLHTKKTSRKPGPALGSCWSWSASTSRTAA